MRVNYKILALSVLFVASMIGCDESSEKLDKSITTTSDTPTIEIVQNPNAKEIKVKGSEIKTDDDKSFYYDYGVKSAYDPNEQPANKDASVRIKPRTVIEANMNVRSPYEAVQISMLSQKLSLKFRIKCSACHDDYANGIIGPSLLTRDADYIYSKIAEFKSGKKSNPLMTDLINMMSDAEIREIADEIYTFNQKIKQIREK